MRHLLLLAASCSLLLPLPLAAGAQTSEKSQRGLRAVQKLATIFNASIFDASPAQTVAELLADSVSLAGALGRLLEGGDAPKESQKLRANFAAATALLLSAKLPLANSAKLLRRRPTVWQRLADYESRVAACGRRFDQFVASADVADGQRFVDEFRRSSEAAYSLFLQLVDARTGGWDLAEEAAKAAGNHQPVVTEFLLHVARVVLRGAMMQVTYERMVGSAAAAGNMESLWRSRMQQLAARMQKADASMREGWHQQLQQDLPRFINDNRRLENRDFVRQLYSFLTQKYHWRHWFAMAYRNVGGWDNHAVWHCGGAVHFRVAGGRNVVVASSDPDTSEFFRPTAESLLRYVDGTVQRQYARDFVAAINDKLGNECKVAALRAAVCWGCNVWFAGRQDRLVYRKATALSGGHMNTFIFG